MGMFGSWGGNPLMAFGAGVLSGRNLGDGIARGWQMGHGLAEKERDRRLWQDQLGQVTDPRMKQALEMAGPERGRLMYAQHLMTPPKGNGFAERAAAAEQFGLEKGSKEYRYFALTGRLPEGYGGAAGASFGRSGQIFQDPKTGEFFTVQFGSDGSRKIEPLTGLAPSRGVSEVDTGTGTMLVDKATGRTVREIDKDLAGAEYAKASGKGLADLSSSKPKAEATVKSVEQSHALVTQEVDRALAMLERPGMAGFVGSYMSAVPGTGAHDLRRVLETIRGNIGFDKLQQMRELSPTGGALGQVAVQELEYLQGVLGSLLQSQSAPQLRTNLERLKTTLADMRQLRRQAFEQTYAPVMGASAPARPTMPASAAPAPSGMSDDELKAALGIK